MGSPRAEALNLVLARSVTVSDVEEKAGGDCTQPIMHDMGMAISGSSPSQRGSTVDSPGQQAALRNMRQNLSFTSCLVAHTGPHLGFTLHVVQATWCGLLRIAWLGRCMRQGRLVRRAPGVVPQQVGPADLFFLDCCGGHLELLQVVHHAAWQHHPEATFNKVCELVKQEFCIFVRRLVASPFKVFVLGFEVPRVLRGQRSMHGLKGRVTATHWGGQEVIAELAAIVSSK